LKIGLTGDTHNNLKNVAIICDIFNSQNLDFVIHTGDISLPKTLYAFDDLHVPLKGVFGNNDQGEKEDLMKVCEEKDFLFQDILEIRISNENYLFAVHDPNDIEDRFYKPGNIIVHGHTHRFRDEIYKNTFIFNPGECAGMIKGMNKIGIVNTESPNMEIISF
jgi:putative phosphoesterase